MAAIALSHFNTTTPAIPIQRLATPFEHQPQLKKERKWHPNNSNFNAQLQATVNISVPLHQQAQAIFKHQQAHFNISNQAISTVATPFQKVRK